MIKIKKPEVPPKILIDNKGKWTKALTDAVQKHGEYKKIPKEEKEKLLQHYRHTEIQEILFQCSHNKCAFCECIPSEGGNIEVEHFAPKSIYFQLAFDWDNFLPVCRKCNEAKSDFDTIEDPIINPSKEDPEKYFDYNLINLIPTHETPNSKIALTTISVCDLNSTRLFKARADLLVNLSIYQQGLSNWLQEIQDADTPQKKKNRIQKLINSIDAIDLLCDEKEKYAAFCRNFLSKSDVYRQAKVLIENFRVDCDC